MLNISKQGTYTDSTGYQWVFYQDDVTSNFFYIIPRPQFQYANGQPVFQITQYETSDSSNGSGYCHIGVELTVPSNVQSAIVGAVSQQFGVSNPIFQALQYNPGGSAYLTFNAAGTTTVFNATVSSFGSNTATFLLQLNKTQLDSLVAAFSASGGTYDVQYVLTVPARLPSVTAVLTFNSSIAYQYQVTQPQHHEWGSDTPGSTQALLNASQSSTVTITWGEANPPVSLQQAVADWANTTLSLLVNAAVQEQMQIQGMTSSESFNINTVSSFTQTYEQNQVVNWVIQPSSTLPSLEQLGLQVSSFTAEVNEQQQVMTVTTNIPFAADTASSSQFQDVLVESVTVTVSYPTLQESEASFTFTANGSATFTAPYSTTAGPEWSVEYTVTYQSQSAPVTGTVSGIDQATYTLALQEVGILSVTFNAAPAFTGSSGQDALSQVDINLTFMNTDGQGQFINESATIQKTSTSQSASITSLVGVPLDATYNYTVKYLYASGINYTAPTVIGANGFYQEIDPAAAPHSTQFMIVLSNSDPNPILNANVNVWYPEAPSIPNIGNQPTEANPTVFTLTPSGSGSYTFATDVFGGYLNGDEPLMYSASINAIMGQTDIDGQMIENDQASVMISTTQRYFTIQIDPSDIDWATAPFSSVQVQVTATVAGTTGSPRAFTWNKNETDPQYMTLSTSPGASVSYAWTATYIEPGVQTQPTKSGTSSNVILNIPATAS